MEPIIYMWQVSACMGVFYGFYFVLLRRLTFFTINRWYLLATLLLSVVIPLLTITVHRETAPIVMQKAVIINQVLPSAGLQINVADKQTSRTIIDWVKIAEIAYLIVTIALFIKLIVTIARFFNKLKNASITKIGGVRIIKAIGNISNGSFFNYVMLNSGELNPEEMEQVLGHEMLHVKHLHSIDRMIVRLMQVAFWFNPFIYRYAQAIEENHEFEVDDEIGRRADKGRYADMLLHLSINRQDILFNSFSKVPLKRRITMLFTKPTNHMKKVIYLLILPLVLISCLAFARFKNDIVQQEQYSVIAGIDLLGDDFKVFIDGKSYDKDIVYKISGSCIKSSEIKPVAPAKVVNGKWADAVVNIKTKKGDIVYMSEQEKENLIKERSVAFDKFYVRLHLKDNSGKPFDKAIVHKWRGASASVDIQPLDKIGFLIDGVFYNENDIRFIDPKDMDALADEVSVQMVKQGQYARGIAAVFTLHTLKKPTGAQSKAKIQKEGKLKPVAIAGKPAPDRIPAIPGNVENDLSNTVSEQNFIRKTVMNSNSPFYSRFHFDRANGKGFDVVAIKYKSNAFTSINVQPNEKAGVFIDNKFYSEDALRKFTQAQTANLERDTSEAHYEMNQKNNLPKGYFPVPTGFITK